MFVNLDIVNVSQDSMEMDVNLKDVQMIVILMEYVHKMENVFAMKILLALIVQKNVAQMIAVEMVYVIVIKNAYANLVLGVMTVLFLLVKIIAEEFYREFAIMDNASAEMDFLEKVVNLRLVQIAALIMESVLKGFVSANLDLKVQIAQLKFVLIIALAMEYVQVYHFLNVLVMKDLLEMIAL